MSKEILVDGREKSVEYGKRDRPLGRSTGMLSEHATRKAKVHLE